MKPEKYKGVGEGDPKVVLSFSCPIDLANDLVEQAKREDLSLSQYIRGLIKTALDQ